ncbi:hypothetical protein K466DRAFT_105007 [Polyporus arcularius HHB13444]|uniref:Secreted protein n=1 Tax=Polyporus arcularius HHB13444 TaxID=1314778 RepID=A0A5C3PCV0_9APHY|nr:hypothetical protein K466DRAFT_105007 [Polyporus arcularius HHB13444]
MDRVHCFGLLIVPHGVTCTLLTVAFPAACRPILAPGEPSRCAVEYLAMIPGIREGNSAALGFCLAQKRSVRPLFSPCDAQSRYCEN